MNRTASVTMFGLFFLVPAIAPGRAQEPAQGADAKAQDKAIEDLVAAVATREQAVRRVRLALTTTGSFPGSLTFKTTGTLRVLRGEQGEVTAVHSVVDYQFDDGYSGHLETVRTPDGLVMFEQNPTAGEVFVQMDKALVADLEWAGKVLQREDLPGQTDARANAPLGSALIRDLAQRYQLRDLGRRDQNGRTGSWLGGDRRPGPGLDGEDTDVPIADHVELFVGEREKALLEVVYLQHGEVVQRIVVDQLVLDEPMPLETFKLDDRGKRPRDVRDYPPMWQQILDVMRRAEDQAKDEVPPSKR